MGNTTLIKNVRTEKQHNRKFVYLSDILFARPFQTFFIDIQSSPFYVWKRRKTAGKCSSLSGLRKVNVSIE